MHLWKILQESLETDVLIFFWSWSERVISVTFQKNLIFYLVMQIFVQVLKYQSPTQQSGFFHSALENILKNSDFLNYIEAEL